MPRCKLTQKTIAKLRAPAPNGVQEIYWDTELTGFGVRCSGTTSAKAYIVQRDLPGGKSRRVTIATVHEMAPAAARDAARELLLEMRRGKDPKQKAAGTLQETLDAYLKVNREISARAHELYTHHVRSHLTAWQGRALASITPHEVDSMHRAIAAKVARGGRHSGHTVANDVISTFRLLYNWAANRDDSLPRNPVRLRGSEWHKVTPRRRPIDPAKLGAWYAAVQALPAMGRDYLLLLLFCGFRRREAAALTWDSIDFGQRTIRLPKTKNRQPLEIPMSDFVRDLLVARRQLGNAGFVFPSYARSGHIEGARPWTDWVMKASGIEFNLHDLRRTFVTIAEGCDISVYALKALVNHKLGSSVTEGYIKMSADRLREPAQKVCDKLKALCGVTAPSGEKVARI